MENHSWIDIPPKFSPLFFKILTKKISLRINFLYFHKKLGVRANQNFSFTASYDITVHGKIYTVKNFVAEMCNYSPASLFFIGT